MRDVSKEVYGIQMDEEKRLKICENIKNFSETFNEACCLSSEINSVLQFNTPTINWYRSVIERQYQEDIALLREAEVVKYKFYLRAFELKMQNRLMRMLVDDYKAELKDD